MEFTGSFFTLLRPVPLLFGVTGLAAICLQGAFLRRNETEGELQERSFRAVSILMWINLITAITYFMTMALIVQSLTSNWLFYMAILVTLLGLAGKYSFLAGRKMIPPPIWESSFSFIGLLACRGGGSFPNLIKASNDQNLSITIFNSSTGLQTLKLMSVHCPDRNAGSNRLYHLCLPHF